ncbi:uncharacterized protein G2W53_022085 [Senna tora]|uniref:Uncharacterized protein n=1 Tax=Senna tora TaxID=362788 RepID=A0A834WLQ2_9FABA|nr:uncharacterized protein G2W53_022085 [Senna tora]
MAHHPCDHEPHSRIKSTQIPKYNENRSFSLTCSTTRLNLYFLSSFETQSRFSIQNVFRHDLKNLPCDHEPHSRIKSTWIPKYNAKRSAWLDTPSNNHEPHSTNKSHQIPKYNAKIQWRFSIQNVLRHDLTHLPYDDEPHSSIKSTRIPKYNAKRPV